MKTWHFRFTVVSILLLLQFNCTTSDKTILESEVWPEIISETKPWTRWWWMGNAVNKPEIERQLKDLAKAGFGGVEITPIYGVKGMEDHYLDFLSDEWMEMLDFTIQKADELGMGVDINLGTGWPFGGPQITPELAASKLNLQKYLLKAGEKMAEKIQITDPRQNPDDVVLLAAMAYLNNGNIIELTDKVDNEGNLDWVSEDACEIVVAFNAKTRQKVKRAAPGGEGWSMDHFSKEALDTYLKRFDDAFEKIACKPRAFFNDSYEVYGSCSTKEIFVEFENQKGYDLKKYLRELASEEDEEAVKRIKSDYREVFFTLLMEEFTLPWATWSTQKKVLTRNQAHGSPGNIIDLYGAVDIPECETFGSSYFPIPGLRRDSADIRNVDPDPVMQKFATSAANILGKEYASSETFTWLAEHFKVSLSQCKPELEQVFLAGVNHVFYHGTTYSPEVGGWPGWLFYASVQFGPVNSFWPHVSGLNEYIARCQSVLQAGNADNDLLVYWPLYDVWDDAGRLDKQISIHNIDEWLHPTQFYQLSTQLMKEGYLVDFASDDIVSRLAVNDGHLNADPMGGTYKTIIVPKCKFMPLATLQKLQKLAEDGATVIFQELPKDVPGLHNLEARRAEFEGLLAVSEKGGTDGQYKDHLIISSDMQETLGNLQIQGESLTADGLKFVRRIVDGDRYYYLVNHTPQKIDQQLTLNTDAKSAVLMDPDNGSYGFVESKIMAGKSIVRVQLESGQSLIVRCTDSDVSQLPRWRYIAGRKGSTVLNGKWQLSFSVGGPELPQSREILQLGSWTDMGDETAVDFSGTGIYEFALNISGYPGEDYLLDLGKVAESAKVLVNGQEVGILWGIPFQTRIGEYLKQGENTIRIEVANLMANRVRHMDSKGYEWRNFHEINFVNIDYEPFDASGWEPMPSGLLGPVTLHEVRVE